jgi:hypothetical protein
MPKKPTPKSCGQAVKFSDEGGTGASRRGTKKKRELDGLGTCRTKAPTSSKSSAYRTHREEEDEEEKTQLLC